MLLVIAVICLILCLIVKRKEKFEDLYTPKDVHTPFIYTPGDFKHINRPTEERSYSPIDESVIRAVDDPMLDPKMNNYETWNTILSPDCMKLLREGNMHSGSFGELVDCLQHNYERAQINNINV